MDRASLNLDRLRAEVAARQEVMAKAVAGVQARARAEAERLRAAEQPPSQPRGQEADDDECDTRDSWMVGGYNSSPAPRGGASPVHQAALDKIESGELTWKDVFSDTTRDRDARALRGFLDERINEVQRMRNGR
jgi:hypothetical protein